MPSKIHLIEQDEKNLKLVFICNRQEDSQIIEYNLNNPYQYYFTRRLSLYEYVLLKSDYPSFCINELIYIPAFDYNFGYVYLVYSTAKFSPNVLVKTVSLKQSTQNLDSDQKFEVLRVQNTQFD